MKVWYRGKCYKICTCTSISGHCVMPAAAQWGQKLFLKSHRLNLRRNKLERFFFLLSQQAKINWNFKIMLSYCSTFKFGLIRVWKPQITSCLSYCPAGIMVISMRSTRVKQFLQKRAKFVFCRSKNTTKLYRYSSYGTVVRDFESEAKTR